MRIRSKDKPKKLLED